MSRSITVNITGQQALRRLCEQAVAAEAGRIRDEAKLIIREEGRIDTGALVQSIESRKVRETWGRVEYMIGSDLYYARFQHDGVTGPVFPRQAKVLRFKPKGSNKFVFAGSTRGFSGIHFLTRALDRRRRAW